MTRRQAGAASSAARALSGRPLARARGAGRRAVWLAVSGAAVVAVAVLAWAFLRGQGNPEPPSLQGIPAGVLPGGLPVLGAATAPVTLEEYADFQCPYCGEYARQTEPRVIRRYVARGEVRIVWHPIAFIGPESVWAAEAALCAQDQGRFWEYTESLFRHQGAENSGAFAMPRLVALARGVGLDPAPFRSCLEGGRYRKAVEEATAEARRRGVDATPTFFINGRKVTGALPFEEMARLLDAALTRSPGQAPGPGPRSP